MKIYKKIALTFSILSIGWNGLAQTAGIQSLESFDYANGTPLSDQNGGWGWMGGWVASDATAATTYVNSNAVPFSYAKPATSSYYVTPGNLKGNNLEGKIIGRYLDTSPTGPYRTWVDATGSLPRTFTGFQTFLLRKELYDDSQIFFGVSDGLDSENLNNGFGIGYFGPIKSNLGGKRYWTIKYPNGTFFRTNKEIVAGKTEFFVISINYVGNTTQTFNCMSDPTVQNGWDAISLNYNNYNVLNGSFKYRSVFFYAEGGNSIDEIRITQNSNFNNSMIYNPTTTPLTGTNAPGPGTPGGPVLTPDNNKWKLDGNAGTNSTYFIGTTDNQDLKFKTNNLDRLIVTKDGNVGIGTAIPSASARLDVAGTVKATGLQLGNGSVLTSIATSPWIVNGTTINYPTGNVGIGTTSPLRPLHVVAETATLRLERTGNTSSANYMGIDFVPAGLASPTNVTWAMGVVPSSNNYTIWNYDGAANTDRFTITKDGNIGIGTSTPDVTSLLEVNGAIKVKSIKLPDGTINSISSLTLWSQNGNGDVYRTTKNVGIGEVAPQEKLHVTNGNILVERGNISISGGNLVIDGVPSSNSAAAGCSGAITGVNYATITFGSSATNGTDDFWITRYSEACDKSEMRVNIGDDAVNGNDKFVIGTTSSNVWTPVFSIGANGETRIKGKLLSHQIKVCTDAMNGSFPDYVFDKDYKLPSLSELDAYIKKHGHLPEIPSAEEVKKEEGFELGMMNVLLLKKVEELTLYIIEQEKKGVVRDKILEEMRNKLSKIQKTKN